MTGTIKTLKENGFGFIAAEGQAKEVFFHSSALVDVAFEDLRQGDLVSFDTESSDRGPRAINVTRAAAQPQGAANDDVEKSEEEAAQAA